MVPAPSESAALPAGRVANMVQSDIRAMTRECDAVGGINLGQGICDLPLPGLVRDGAVAAMDAGHNTYSYPEGARELRLAIAGKLARDNDIEADPDSEIVVTVGATGAFTAAVTALLDAGDGIVIPEPYYGYHLNAALLAGLVPQYLTLAAPRFTLTAAALEEVVDERTRAIVLCTPSNPSGKMLSAGEIDAVGRVAAAHDLLVITDEIYEYIRYDGREHISPVTHPELAGRTVTIMGLSKTFSITGWRLGYAVAPPALARAMTLVHDLYYVCAPTPLQVGAAAGFAAPPSFFADLALDYEEKRGLLGNALTAAGLTPIVPEGAYYMLADVTRLNCASAKEAALRLLREVGVASVPGSSFYRGSAGDGLVRFCYAKEMDVLAEACGRLAAFKP
ncbi:MAG TPA: pyridoxal phosphate-dependent aminotransferase [Planctomycetota bacterium]|nr:pyridoxal phosphate-dependent aminotransferase [Planctomycetota bacterium]